MYFNKFNNKLVAEQKKQNMAQGIKIANPIYDTVFKYLMENKRIARFFIETLIGEKVTEIAVIPQEYVYKKAFRKKEKETKDINETKDKDSNTFEFFSVIRYDFVATISTETGENKKVLIELQKSRKYTELLRFRQYLGEQYKRVDVINTKTEEVEKSLPIICIYILGFKLLDHDTPALKVGRVYKNLINNRTMSGKDQFVEALTHDGYFVQIPRIKGKPRKTLGKLLSIFEQRYFIDDKEIVKMYDHKVDNENIKEIIDILRNVAADPEERKNIEAEWLALKDEEGYEKAMKTIETLQNENEQQGKTIAQQGDTIAQQGDTIAQLINENEQQGNKIAQLQNENEQQGNKIEALQNELKDIKNILEKLEIK